MAEVLLGTISSVAGITSLAVQAADGLNKLRKFCINVKDAPKELKHILRQLDVLSMQVNEILTAEESSYGPLTGSASLGGSLSLCEQSVSEVLTIVLQLEAAIERSRTWGSIKKVLKNDEIKELNGRLERAIMLLNLSCTINGHKSISRSMLRIEDAVSDMDRQQAGKTFSAVIDDLGSSSNISTTSLQRELPQDFTDEQLSINVRYLKTAGNNGSQHRPKGTRKRIFQVRLPQVLIGQMWEFQSSRSTAGWTFGFRIYNVTPWNSPLFQLSEDLDVEGVKSLFETGQASPYDIDSRGRNAFAYAAMRIGNRRSHSLEVYQFWTYLGLEVNRYGLSYIAGRISHADKSLCARYASLVTQLDPGDFEVGATLFYRPGRWPCDIYRSLENHFDIFTEPLSKRLERVFSRSLPDQFFCKAPIEAFQTCLGCDITDCSLMEAIFSNAKTFLAPVMYIIGHTCVTDRDKARLQLYEYFSSSLRHQMDLSSMYHSYHRSPTTLMDHFIDGYAKAAFGVSHGWFDSSIPITGTCERPNTYSQMIREAMHEWLSSLVEVGFDLTVTGRQERKQIKMHDIHAYSPPECECLRGLWVCKVVDLEYGSSPKDWRIRVSWRLNQKHVWEYLSGEFWQSLERPRSTMPGEWRDEWDDRVPSRIDRWRVLHIAPAFKNIHRVHIPSRSWRKQRAKALAAEEAESRHLPGIPGKLMRHYQSKLRRGSVRKTYGLEAWGMSLEERWSCTEKMEAFKVDDEIEAYYYNEGDPIPRN